MVPRGKSICIYSLVGNSNHQNKRSNNSMIIKPPKLPFNQLTDQCCRPSIAKNSSVTSLSSWSSYVNKPSDIDGEICTFPPLFQIRYNVRLMSCLYRPHSNLKSKTYNSLIVHHQLMSIYFGFIYKCGFRKIHDLFTIYRYSTIFNYLSIILSSKQLSN